MGSRRGNREGGCQYEAPNDRRRYGRWVWRTLVTGVGRITTVGRKGESKTAVRLRHEEKVRDYANLSRPSKGSLGEWTDIWLRLYLADLAPRTVTYYRAMLGHLEPLMDRPMSQITPDELLLALGRIERGASRRKAYEVLRIALNRAVKTGRLRANVCTMIDAPGYESRKVTPPTHEQVAAILDGLRGKRDEALIVVALATGLRQGELVGLRWMDLEVGSDALSVRAGALSVGRPVVPREPPSGSEAASTGARLHVRGQLNRNREYVGAKRGSERIVPLVPVAVTALEAHRQRVTLARGWAPQLSGTVKGASEHVAQSVAQLPPERDYIFTDAHGRPMTGYEAHRRWKVALKAGGVAPCPMHASRHWFATAQSGEQRDVVSRLLGHKRSKVTESYTHLSAADWERATDRIERALGG